MNPNPAEKLSIEMVPPTMRDLAMRYTVKRLTIQPWFKVEKDGNELMVQAWWHEGDVVVKHPNPVIRLAVAMFERSRVARTQFGE